MENHILFVTANDRDHFQVSVSLSGPFNPDLKSIRIYFKWDGISYTPLTLPNVSDSQTIATAISNGLMLNTIHSKITYVVIDDVITELQRRTDIDARISSQPLSFGGVRSVQ